VNHISNGGSLGVFNSFAGPEQPSSSSSLLQRGCGRSGEGEHEYVEIINFTVKVKLFL
jgi:hypothetical protein